MDELSGRDHQDEFLVGQMMVEEWVFPDGPGLRQVDKVAVLVLNYGMRGEPAEPLRKPRLVHEPTPHGSMLGVDFAPFLDVGMAVLLDRLEVRA